MKQHEFMFALSVACPTSIRQTTDGKCVATLRKGVTVTHDYKSKNQMTLEFTDENLLYIIPSHVELKEICAINISDGSSDSQDVLDILHTYAERYLKK